MKNSFGFETSVPAEEVLEILLAILLINSPLILYWSYLLMF